MPWTAPIQTPLGPVGGGAYTGSGPLFNEGLTGYDPSREGPMGYQTLKDLVGLFGGEYNRTRKLYSPVEGAFMQQALTPGALFGAASTAAQGYASDLFKPGGQIAQLIAQARGKAIGSGFAPSSAEGSENGILQSGISAVANAFAQNAGQLESQRFGALSGAFGQGEEASRGLLEDIFTGVGNASQQDLARQQLRSSKFLGIF